LENNRNESAENDDGNGDDTFEKYPANRKAGIKIRNLRKTFKTEAGKLCYVNRGYFPS